jgi:hypothetical protein
MIRLTAASAGVLLALGSPLRAETWSCTYPGFGTEKGSVIVPFVVKGNKIESGRFGVPVYDIVANNEHALIGVDHYSKFDGFKRVVRVYVATVIIEKHFGRFMYSINEIGSEPGHRTGHMWSSRLASLAFKYLHRRLRLPTC